MRRKKREEEIALIAMIEYLRIPFSSSYSAHLQKAYSDVGDTRTLFFIDNDRVLMEGSYSLPPYCESSLRLDFNHYYLFSTGVLEDCYYCQQIEGLVVSLVGNSREAFAITNEGELYTSDERDVFRHYPLPVPVHEVYCTTYYTIVISVEGELFILDSDLKVRALHGERINRITTYSNRTYVLLTSGLWAMLFADENCVPIAIPLSPLVENVDVVLFQDKITTVVKMNGKECYND